MAVIFFAVFMTVLIVPQLALCWYLTGYRRGLSLKAWLKA